METLTSCPICSANKFTPFISCKDHTVSRETFQVVQCDTCGFRFTNPRPDEKEIGKYYQSEEYISHSGTSRGVVNTIYGIVRDYTVKQKVKLINKQILNPKSQILNILDIGCGTGEFLNACKNNGWNICGVEPSEIARQHAKTNFGIEPLSQDKLFELNKNQFSVVTMWHVLEHVHQLEKTIKQIKHILIDKGALIIAVPNCNSFDAKYYEKYWAAWDLPRHIYHFTERDIKKLLNKFEFTFSEIVPMKFDSYYVSLLSEKYKTGKTNLVTGVFNGWKSNRKASHSEIGFSSQIYIAYNTKRD